MNSMQMVPTLAFDGQMLVDASRYGNMTTRSAEFLPSRVKPREEIIVVVRGDGPYDTIVETMSFTELRRAVERNDFSVGSEAIAEFALTEPALNAVVAWANAIWLGA